MAEPLSISKFLIDLLLQLASGPGGRREKFFRTHAEPLQANVEKIHKDYQHAFGETHRMLSKRSTSSKELQAVREVIAFLHERRRQLEPERQLAREIARHLKEAKARNLRKPEEKAVLNYCEAVVMYLNASDPFRGVCGHSWFTDFIEAAETKAALLAAFQQREDKESNLDVWATMAISGRPRGELLDALDEVLHKSLPTAYAKVCSTYAALRTWFI